MSAAVAAAPIYFRRRADSASRRGSPTADTNLTWTRNGRVIRAGVEKSQFTAMTDKQTLGRATDGPTCRRVVGDLFVTE